jgi:hypothetical protein
MGLLYYGAERTPSEIPDRILAHMKVVTATKLRRNESFTVSWRHDDNGRPGRTTLWMQPSIPLRFVFDSPEPEMLDPAYLQELATAAASSQGLMLDWTGHSDTPETSGSRSRVKVAA